MQGCFKRTKREDFQQELLTVLIEKHSFKIFQLLCKEHQSDLALEFYIIYCHFMLGERLQLIKEAIQIGNFPVFLHLFQTIPDEVINEKKDRWLERAISAPSYETVEFLLTRSKLTFTYTRTLHDAFDEACQSTDLSLAPLLFKHLGDLMLHRRVKLCSTFWNNNTELLNFLLGHQQWFFKIDLNILVKAAFSQDDRKMLEIILASNAISDRLPGLLASIDRVANVEHWALLFARNLCTYEQVKRWDADEAIMRLFFRWKITWAYSEYYPTKTRNRFRFKLVIRRLRNLKRVSFDRHVENLICRYLN